MSRVKSINLGVEDSSSDEETVDDGSDASTEMDKPETGEKPDDSNKKREGEPEAEELLRTKRARFMRPFTEDHLVGIDGLRRIYDEFPLNCKYEARGSELAYLRKVITMYKSWAFQLHPGVAFKDVVSKCENLGAKGKVRTHLMRLREDERDRYLVRYSFLNKLYFI
jgi:hypothetical protein